MNKVNQPRDSEASQFSFEMPFESARSENEFIRPEEPVLKNHKRIKSLNLPLPPAHHRMGSSQQMSSRLNSMHTSSPIFEEEEDKIEDPYDQSRMEIKKKRQAEL